MKPSRWSSSIRRTQPLGAIAPMGSFANRLGASGGRFDG